nr:hypothetical protein [Tanacetum cinerariifolium]
MIKCPCNKCCLGKWLDVESAHGDILRHGFLPWYTEWIVHREHTISLPPSQYTNVNVEETFFGQDDIRGLGRDGFGINSLPSDNTQLEDTTIEGDTEESTENGDHSDEGVSYKRLLEECDKELYAGCKYSNLSFILHLYHIKCIGGISNMDFSMILELLRDAFPRLIALPSSTYEAKKFTKDLGLGYEKIHACPNDCMLYWDDRAGQQSCHICKASPYKSDEVGGSSKSRKSNKLTKVLHYFPLIPRLKRLYKCEKIAKDMRWHDTGRTKDGKLRHLADGLAWSAFNDRYLQFTSDPQSVRLGLASDGFNPFGTMSTSHSTWPGEKAPGNDIDIYLKPLIKELQLLWKGVDAYDAFSKQHFKLKGSLMWTINDFPAYANLSGWSTKGRVACPVCANSIHSRWLKHGKKFCYIGHQRWLEPNHSCRFQKERFDATIENRGPPTPLTGSDVLKQLSGIRFKYGKSKKKTREEDGGSTSTHAKEATHDEGAFECTNTIIEEDIDSENLLWKKKSVFFDLEYWEHNLLRHNLDVMHIEKNVSDNIIGTLLGLDGKTKDNKNTRKDLEEMGIRHDLHLINLPNGKLYLPSTCYTMSLVEKSNFLQLLKDLKVPDGYSSNFSRGVSVKDHKISNLKTHDGHILMQDVLPIALRASAISRTQSRLVKAVTDYCFFFKGLCAKVLDPSELVNMEYQLVQTLYELEQIFPPSFFTVMVHLTIHLIYEAKLGGPIHYRWMYPVERYFEGVETPFNRPLRNDENVVGKEMYMFNSSGRKLGKVEILDLDGKSLAQAHCYCFLTEKQALRDRPMDSKTIEKLMVDEFPWWLKNQVSLLQEENVDEEVLSLAIGPNIAAKQYKGFITNGYRFLTRRHEEFKKTQKLRSHAIRPSFLYDMRQNSSSSSSSLQASVGPDVEINLADQYEHNLLSEVEIIDVNENIIRTQKMTAKQVYKLKWGEKVLVDVNKDYQLIKNAGGLCSRFMTLILKQPNLCPPGCQGLEGMTVKYRLKQRLYQQAANKLHEANGINRLNAQEKNYIDEELLAALDLLEPPENFIEHQWRVYKSHLRKPIAK